MQLLTLVQQQAIKPLTGLNTANNKDVQRFNAHIQSMQDNELTQLITARFLQDIGSVLESSLYVDLIVDFETNKSNPTYASVLPYYYLLNGGEFVNCQNEIIKQKGLLYILAHLSFSVWVIESSIIGTASGYKVQNDVNSGTEHASRDLRDQLIKRTNQSANNAWQITKEYLNLNSALFKGWYYARSGKVGKFFAFSLIKTRYIN